MPEPTSSRLYLGDIRDESYEVDIGPFRLAQRLGTGSMGEVWRGCHVEQDVDVALKVIVSDRAMKNRFHRAFRQEVRSMAGLNHPFVVDVYDYGTVGKQAEELSLGQIRAGSPYLVMEYAEAGTLADRIDGNISWEITQLVLFSLLDALAHSHARGVLHRDLKPQNVLLARHGSGLGVRLSDYGLAYAMRDTQEVANWHRTAGTPEYMAPELVTGRWRQYGPPTDLYALGCLAFELLEGRPPFGGQNVVQIARAQLEAPAPNLSDDVRCPPEMNRWLQTLLAKSVSDRFSSAANAARALRQISGPLDEAKLQHDWAVLIGEGSAVSMGDNGPPSQSAYPSHSLDIIINHDHVNNEQSQPENGCDGRSLPIPEQWRRPNVIMPSLRMVGTGRGIFRLRRLPVMGRESERDHLWRRLCECAHQNKVGVTLLSGPAGVGKDYLAQWLCDRSGELGAAQVFRAYHESSDEFVDGFAEMVRRRYSLTGLPRGEVELFFKSLLTDLGATEPYEWKAITQVICGGDDHEGVHFQSPKQRYMACARFLERLSRRGPLLLWLNDVQWGMEILQLVQLLVEQPEIEAPIYVVMTAGADRLAAAERHSELVDSILEAPEADKLDLGPLDQTTIRQLVEKALFLEPSASYEVARRSGGNPLHALELVGAWLDRDLLRPDRHGYVLDEEDDPGVPGEWTEFWLEVVERLTAEYQGGQAMLEVGAILGEQIRRPVWKKAADYMGVKFQEELVDELLERVYIYETPRGLVFSQNMLREALFESARSAGRWRQACHAAARALDTISQDDLNVDERVGLLLLEAGKSAEGAQRLLLAVRRRFRNREYHAMIHLARRGQMALRGHESRDSQQVRAELLEQLSHGWNSIGRRGLALREAEKARKIADELQEPGRMGGARLRELTPTFIRGDLDEARQIATEALEILEGQAEFESTYASICLLLANIELRQENYDEALQRIDEASEALSGVEAPVVSCQADFVRLKARMLRGEDLIREEVEVVLDKCRSANTTYGEVQVRNIRAEIARREGELDEAKKWYESAVTLANLLDPDVGVPARVNLALVALERGDLGGAGQIAQRILQDLRRTRRPQMRLYTIAAMLPMHISRVEFVDASQILEEIEEIIDELGVGADPDIAFCISTAGELLEKEKGQEDLHRKVLDLLAIVDP